MAEALADTTAASWAAGSSIPLPETGPVPAVRIETPPPVVPPGHTLLTPPGDDPPKLRFPEIEKAAERIAKAEIVSPDEFRAMSGEARRQAFTISGDLARESVETIRDTLSENIRQGADREKFISDVEGLFIEGMPLSEAHVEQVFRNNVNAAWSDGQETAVRAPLLVDAFPYRLYHATTDGRVRPEHFSLERRGLNKTNVYHKDDPVWQKFRPPWEWNCRCSPTPATVEQAAAKGVREAQQWIADAERIAAERDIAFEQALTLAEPEHEFVESPPFEPPLEFRR